METKDTLKQLDRINEIKTDSINQFIDRVTTVSTGALAFSITFRNSIIGTGADFVWLLQVAWIALSICVVAGVFVHLSGASAAIRLAKGIEKGDNTITADAHPFYYLLHLAVLFAFPAGLTAFTLFAVLNTN